MAARERLVTATIELMRRHGIAGTAVSEILAESGVSRRSIYLNFPGGKSDLVTEATRQSGATITAILGEILDQDDPLSTFIALWVDLLESSDFDAGCPVVAATLGRAVAPDAADEAGTVFGTWHSLVTARLIRDGIQQELAGPLATTILAATEGAVLLAQAHRDARPLHEVGEHLTTLVSAHRS